MADKQANLDDVVASLRAEAPIEILDVTHVATSFPGFAQLATSVGLRIEEGARAAGGP